MASYYDELFGHFNEPEPTGGTVYGGDNPDEEAEIDPAVEKEAGEAFDNMMEKPEQILDRIFKGIWTAGGKA